MRTEVAICGVYVGSGLQRATGREWSWNSCWLKPGRVAGQCGRGEDFLCVIRCAAMGRWYENSSIKLRSSRNGCGCQMALNALQCGQFLRGIATGQYGLPTPLDLFEDIFR